MLLVDQKINEMSSESEVEENLYIKQRYTPSVSPPSGLSSFLQNPLRMCPDNLLTHPISQCLLMESPPIWKVSSFLSSHWLYNSKASFKTQMKSPPLEEAFAMSPCLLLRLCVTLWVQGNGLIVLFLSWCLPLRWPQTGPALRTPQLFQRSVCFCTCCPLLSRLPFPGIISCKMYIKVFPWGALPTSSPTYCPFLLNVPTFLRPYFHHSICSMESHELIIQFH